MKNRFMLAPLTNLQSHADGTLSDDEFRWLTLRAAGRLRPDDDLRVARAGAGTGLSRASSAAGRDAHLRGPHAARRGDQGAPAAVAFVQLHHAGMRSPRGADRHATGLPVRRRGDRRARADARRGRAAARGLHRCRRARRARRLRRRRTARRARLRALPVPERHDTTAARTATAARSRTAAGSLFEIIAGIRARCRPDFTLGIRLSPERFGLRARRDARDRAAAAARRPASTSSTCRCGTCSRNRTRTAFKGAAAVDWFTDLERGATCASASPARSWSGATRAHVPRGTAPTSSSIGRAAILHHDFPRAGAGRSGFRARCRCR